MRGETAYDHFTNPSARVDPWRASDAPQLGGQVSLPGKAGIFTYRYAGDGIVAYAHHPNNPSGLDWTGLDWTGLDWTGLDMAWGWVKRNVPAPVGIGLEIGGRAALAVP